MDPQEQVEPKSETQNQKTKRNPKLEEETPETLNSKQTQEAFLRKIQEAQGRNGKPYPLHWILSPGPVTHNPKPQTLNPKP